MEIYDILQKKDHFTRDCRATKNRKVENKPFDMNSREGLGANPSTAFIVDEEAFDQIPLADFWITDGVASAHVTYRRDFFHSSEAEDNPNAVIFSNYQR
ncbi:hypothetical protein JTB14_031327 [Gonioctena quinquepunctata]|nr:hypothetical protein JTB14_031327 [Gonioctena quinquepunctata]